MIPKSIDNNHPTKSYKITTREQEILFLIAYEYSNKEIAKILHLSPCTIHSHRKSLIKKFSVSNTAGLICKAYQGQCLPINKNNKLIEKIEASSGKELSIIYS